MLGLLSGFKKLKKVKMGKNNKSIVILDFSEKTIRLPNGEVIRREDIINFDPHSKSLTYRSPEGTLKTINLGKISEENESQLLSKFFDRLQKGREESGIYI